MPRRTRPAPPGRGGEVRGGRPGSPRRTRPAPPGRRRAPSRISSDSWREYNPPAPRRERAALRRRAHRNVPPGDGPRRNRSRLTRRPWEAPMTRSRTLTLGAALAGLITALGVGQAAVEAAGGRQGVLAPAFEVDPFWPKPLPNHWILGSTIGVGVDSRDHVFIIHRGEATLNPRTESGGAAKPPVGECCFAAPPTLGFDPQGKLGEGLGGPGAGMRVAAPKPGDFARRQGQRVDRRERERFAPPRLADPQVHPR